MLARTALLATERKRLGITQSYFPPLELRDANVWPWMSDVPHLAAPCALTQVKRPSARTDSLHRTRPGSALSNQPQYCMFQSLVPIILCVLPEATMSAKPCCVSRL